MPIFTKAKSRSNLQLRNPRAPEPGTWWGLMLSRMVVRILDSIG